jgi:hypothetical protein
MHAWLPIHCLSSNQTQADRTGRQREVCCKADYYAVPKVALATLGFGVALPTGL